MVFNPDNRRRIAIFGGSFSPPHIGHSAICKWLFMKGLVDEIWVIPCYIHPFGKNLMPYEDRLYMCRLAFHKMQFPVEVSDVERELGGVSYTIRTIEYLKKKYPENRFALIMGGDVARESPAWKEFEKIKEQVDIVKIPRGSDSNIPNVSSTEVRRRLESGTPLSDLVENEVEVYIVTKGLYNKM